MTSAAQWREIFNSKRRSWLTFSGVVLLLSTFVLNFYVSSYADSAATSTVGDLFLDNIPIFKIDFLFFWAVLIFWLVMLGYHILRPKQLAFIMWSISAFVVVRCFFISLTHLGPPESAIEIPDSLSWFNFTADMFFSGHVGAPFLVALLLDNKVLKRIIYLYSVCMVVIVLMAHGHYSIDIFASFFISHSISILMKKTEHKFYDSGNQDDQLAKEAI